MGAVVGDVKPVVTEKLPAASASSTERNGAEGVAAYRRGGACAGTGPFGPGGEAFWPRP